MPITFYELILILVSLGILILIVGYVQLDKDDKEGKMKFKIAFFALIVAYILMNLFI